MAENHCTVIQGGCALPCLWCVPLLLGYKHPLSSFFSSFFWGPSNSLCFALAPRKPWWFKGLLMMNRPRICRITDVILLSINLVAKTFLNWWGSDLVSLLFWDIASSYSKQDEWLWYTLLLHSLTQVAQDVQSSYCWLPQRSLVQYGKSVFRPCWQCAVDLFL